jgi:hypothetical protein
MRLTDLDPQWVKRSSVNSYWVGRDDGMVIPMADADGVLFLCPRCFQLNDGEVGTHSVLCWRPRVPQDISPMPGRWEFEGSSVEDLTLVAGSSSVLLTSDPTATCSKCKRTGASADATCHYCPCRAHFFVRHGAIEFC